ncbi:MAG: hypothetical protein COY38_00800 [Candidatus Aenigmarchaeota archaeon CG_4_10_14_0_8_um_filter_37_24]|nr:hypothetical protein [Candidatus Aenigmarchaeota archaeon]OIN86206.1 MAG: hypothetical protein AUJ50_03980 [Candidatus Aenigmarchaeota archaeon CG1_02_38_14]PIV69066.1 MAG: hypothetical protein COS07_02065 [Candidatus Aenigmarchaeota archaeon CG01_land_8_20_14_3_00_37_9]PIW41328.1 MAG: hypothetical protein COW21_02355 [Candidatus Aenigmarchaeota archaeon CG15_BIG_FIL_POST_REV_8_21_14_020_37_27]PIX50700.1 MAG: hypothetical protein COZ52_02840 [Candidatus Aenigmarchaeota archaeon CG_4_8_14_3_u
MNEIKKMEEKKRDIMNTLSQIQKGYENGFISKEEYEEIIKSNRKRIENIDDEIQSMNREKPPNIIPANAHAEINQKPDLAESGNKEEILSRLDKFNLELKGVKNLLENNKKNIDFQPDNSSKNSEAEARIEDIKKSIENSFTQLTVMVQVNDKFYQSLSLLSILSDKKEIIKELFSLENNLKRLKMIGFWDDKKEDFLLKSIVHIMQTWKEADDLETANIYFEWVKRMKLIRYERQQGYMPKA